MRELLMPYGGSGIRRLLMAHALTGQKLVEQTATGNPATFTATAAKPLIQCQAAFSPVQSGSGDPSPENIRPITGWTGVNVYHSGSDTSNPTTYPVTWTSQGTVYGGYVDLVTGVLVATQELITVNSSNSEVREGGYYGYYVIVIYTKISNNSSGTVCSHAKIGNINYAGSVFRIPSNTVAQISLPDFTTEERTQAAITADDIQLIYNLRTPETYQLTPQQITALVGTNNIWSDANGDMTIKYLTKGA